MGFELNDEQWDFIFKHYPEYGAAPYEMMTWIYGTALENETMEAEAYGAPTMGGEQADHDSDDAPGIDSKYDKGFGPKK